MSATTGVPPLLLSAAYAPTPTLELVGRRGVCACGEAFHHPTTRGRVPALGPCCRPKPKRNGAPKGPRRNYTADEILRRISVPGCALVAFEGGVTLFAGQRHYQADSVYSAMHAIDAEARS